MQLEPGHWLHCAALAWIFTWLTQQGTRSWICEELPTCRTLQFQKQAECHRQSACGYLWAPAMSACLASSSGWISLSEAVLAGVKDESSSPTEILISDTCAKTMSYPIGHWIPFLNSVFRNAALSFDIHPGAQRNFSVSIFSVLLAESHGQKKIFS